MCTEHRYGFQLLSIESLRGRGSLLRSTTLVIAIPYPMLLSISSGLILDVLEREDVNSKRSSVDCGEPCEITEDG